MISNTYNNTMCKMLEKSILCGSYLRMRNFDKKINLRTMTTIEINAYACFKRSQKQGPVAYSAHEFIAWYCNERPKISERMVFLKRLDDSKPFSFNNIQLSGSNIKPGYISPNNKKAPYVEQYANYLYQNQKDRCENINNKAFKYYGGKGIEVIYSRREFIDWFKLNVGDRPLRKLSISRKDHSKSYCFENIEIQSISENSKERIHRLGTPFKKEPVEMYDKVTGKTLKKFESITSASEKTGMWIGTITRWLDKAPTKTKYRFLFRRSDVQ